MTDQPPRLAVVIPTFNRARTIRRAVDSVLSSPQADIELVVVDDCSTDDTLAVLSQVADRRLIVVRSDRQGFGNRARNRGVERSRAPLLAFLDSDDEFLPGRIERILELFSQRTDIHAVVDGFHVVRGGSRRFFAPPQCTMSGDLLVRLLVSHALPLTNSVISVRRQSFEDVGGFDSELRRHQDRDLLLRLARRHSVAIGTGFDVVKYQSKDSISRDAAGYAEGLNALVARHDIFGQPVLRDLLGYLIARSVIHELATARLLSAWRISQTIRSASHLPFGVVSAMTRYRRGRRARRSAEAELAAIASAK